MSETTASRSPAAEPWQAFAQRLAALTELAEDEIEFLRHGPIEMRAFAAGDGIFAEGEAQESIYLCAVGWGAQIRMLPDGDRQIVDFILPGCLFGHHASDEGANIVSAEALTDLYTAVIPMGFIAAMGRERSRLACAFGLALSEETSRLAERVVTLGRRDATQRLGHFFLELRHRLGQPDETAETAETAETDVRLPVPQREVADFLGLTPVHVNRTMRRMQEDGIIDYDDAFVEILDPDGLAAACDFDAERLNATPFPAALRAALLAID